MKQRLFIAINLSKEDKDGIEYGLSKLPDIPGARIMDRENWHITLTFLGYLEQEAAGDIIKAMAETVKNFPAPEIDIVNIDYGPAKSAPRMIWLNGSSAASRKLAEIKDFLENALVDRGVNFKIEHKGFKAHITLARLDKFNKSELPSLDKFQLDDFLINFEPESLDLMESHLSKSGAEYSILQKINFK